MAIRYKGKLLRRKEVKGKVLKDEIEGELLKDKIIEGNPLWKDKKELNEERYKKENLNE